MKLFSPAPPPNKTRIKVFSLKKRNFFLFMIITLFCDNFYPSIIFWSLIILFYYCCKKSKIFAKGENILKAQTTKTLTLIISHPLKLQRGKRK